MHLPSAVVVTLRLLLAVAFAALLMAQLRALPAMYDDWVRDAPDVASTGWPVLPAGLLVLACVEAVIVCTWRLLTLVERDQIFSARAFRFVDAVLGVVAAAALVLLALLVHLLVAVGSAVLPVVVLLALIGAAVVGLLMVVMRALLRQATALRTDLDAVV